DRDCVVSVVRHQQVGFAVTVDVGGGHGTRATTRGKRLLGGIAGGGGAGRGDVEQHRDRGAAVVRHQQAVFAAAVSVGGGHRLRIRTRGKGLLGGIAGGGGAGCGGVEQHRDAAAAVRHQQVGSAVAVDVSGGDELTPTRGKRLLGGVTGGRGAGCC